MFIKRDQSKALQFGFLTLLLISIAQVAWWMTENIHYARTIQHRMVELYQTEAEVLSAGSPRVPEELVNNLPPHLEFAPGSQAVRVRQNALAQLNDDARRRINRYLWEGGFFLLVLIAGTTILTTAIRHDRELRRRQQNFLAAVSHEFKSPLASIRLSAETLSLRSTEALTQRLSRRILDDNERLLRMVDNLLDTARLEEGRQTLKPEMIELRPLIAACIDELSDRAHQHNISIAYAAPDSLSVSIDPEALATVLRNLLDNAVKACIAGDGHRIQVEATREERGVVIEICDDGLGFPSELAGLMFDKFYRIGDELRRTTPGTGLGLYIVKRLVEQSGARITAHSDGAGSGARFTIIWPRTSNA